MECKGNALISGSGYISPEHRCHETSKPASAAGTAAAPALAVSQLGASWLVERPGPSLSHREAVWVNSWS